MTPTAPDMPNEAALAAIPGRCAALIAAAAGTSAEALQAAATALADAVAALPRDGAAWAGADALAGHVRDALAAAEDARIHLAYHADRNRRRLESLSALAGVARPAAYTRAGRYG